MFVQLFALAALLGANTVLASPPKPRPDPEPCPDPNPRLDDSVAAALRALGRRELRQPGSLPNPRLPEGFDTLPGIEHVVLLMMENHSFDNMFGMLGRGDGFTLDRHGNPIETSLYPNGSVQHAFPMPNTCQLPSQPSQEWSAGHNAFDNGTNSGFVSTPIAPGKELVGGVAMGYYTAEHLPFTYDLASKFPIGDRWFSSVMGQTFPNRMYLMAGTSEGITDNSIGFTTVAQPPAGTIFNMLDKHNITWRNYVSEFPLGASPELFTGSDNLTEAVNVRTIDQFLSDAAAGTFPSFSFVEPDYSTTSQENPQNVAAGEGFMAEIINAVGHSPAWSKTVFILNYDEWGGYYDHVIPPPALRPDDVLPILAPTELMYEGFQRYGFRVPAVVVSPYAKQDYVSHVLHDHTSVLAFLELKYNLPALTFRDANANDLTDFLDLDALDRQRPTFPTFPKLVQPGNTTVALECSLSGPGIIPPPGSVSPKDQDTKPHWRSL
jgi:phospholipase C